MSRNDPFPMSSPEAANLAASVEGGTSSSGWNSMSTKTAGSAGTSKESAEGGGRDASASEVLVGGVNTGDHHAGSDDIYDQEDVEDGKEDEFFDRPLWESRGTPLERTLAKGQRFLGKIYTKLYGDDLPVSEMLRTLCLASVLFWMIGGYWCLRSLKDPVLTALCGVSVIPKAKMLSVVVVLVVVSIYNHFLDSDIPRHKLFYLFGSFYFGLFTFIALMLMHPTIGLANQQPSPWRVLGWISYCSIESFGSVMVSLFWSFANSNFSLKTAKASYGVMVATAQVGSILGPTIVNRYAEVWGPAKCYLVGALCMLLLQGAMYMYVSIYGSAERNAKTTEVKKTGKAAKAGILEGLKLFYEHNYVKGIFAISCLFMVEVTIVDFTMKVLARDYFAEEHPCLAGMSCYNTATGEHGMSEEATAAFTTFMGFFGQATNTLSFLMSLLGTSAVIRYLGLRWTLLLFPSLCLATIIMVRLQPTLYVVFLAMICLKAASYSLNNPTKEILYQPTSSAVRYKAKSWIDIFGARGSKAMGSVVTNAFSDSATTLVANGSLVGMAVASFLIWNARFMGLKFDEYMASGYIVGADPATHEAAAGAPDSAAEDTKLASAQNESEDTSCALYEGDTQLGVEEQGQEDDGNAKKPQVTMV